VQEIATGDTADSTITTLAEALDERAIGIAACQLIRTKSFRHFVVH
jgi:hypothetical protein